MALRRTSNRSTWVTIPAARVKINRSRLWSITAIWPTFWSTSRQVLPAVAYDPPKQSVSIKQEGCRYVPHMAAVMAGQPVQLLDADQTIHNIHPMPKNNPEWNQSQMPNSEPLDKSFRSTRAADPVKCNLHPWMHMYLNVIGNPYFAVTGRTASSPSRICRPGTYTIAALQEKYGEKTQVHDGRPQRRQEPELQLSTVNPC